MNVESGFQIADVWGIVRRRAKYAMGVALAVTLASYWIAMALPNEYESYSTVLVEPQSVDPGLVAAGIPESNLNERLHLMAAQILSRPRLSRIIDELGLYEEESDYMVREEVINLMRERVRVEPVVPELEQTALRGRAFEINQFRIFFRDDNSLTAMKVAQRLANDFIEEHISVRVKVSQKSVEFIEAELGRLSTRIREIEARVAAVKAENPGRLPEDMASNQRLLDRLSGQLADAQRQHSGAASDEAFFRAQSQTARELTRTNDDASPERRVQMLELALANFEARGFTAKHPDVVNTKVELQAIRVQMVDREKQAREGGAPLSFAQQNADAEARRAALRRVASEQEIERLRVAALGVQSLLAETPAVAEQLDGLERVYLHLFQSYQDFSNRRLEAGVQADLERRQLGEQFRVLEAAFRAPAPKSPNRVVIVLLGAFFGMALGAGLVIVLEAVDSSVHTARQLQSTLRIPVLAAIPQIWLESDRVAQRRSRIRAAVATVGVVVFTLVGGAANYAWVNRTPGEDAALGTVSDELPGRPGPADAGLER